MHTARDPAPPPAPGPPPAQLLDSRGQGSTQKSAGQPGAPAPAFPVEQGQPPALSPASGRGQETRVGSFTGRVSAALVFSTLRGRTLFNHGRVPRTEARGLSTKPLEAPPPRPTGPLGSGGQGGRKPWDLRGKVAKTLHHPGSQALCAHGCPSTASLEGALPLHTREAPETGGGPVDAKSSGSCPI